MSTIYKEIEIEIGEIKTNDLCQELEERLDASTFLYTEEFQEKCKPKIEELLSKLNEIRIWLEHPSSRQEAVAPK